MFSFKKITSFVLLSIFLVTLGLGCKGPDTTAVINSKKVTLEYWTVYDDVDELNKLVTEYEAARPYIQVNVKQIPANEFYQRLIEALAEDKGPDIISVQNRALGGMKSKLAPMPAAVSDTIVQQKGGLVGPSQTAVDTSRTLLTPPQIATEYVRTVSQDVVMDGKVYGLPLSIDTMGIFYNKDLLDRSGIAQLPTTWTEFQAAVRKITKYDSKGKIIQAGTALGTGNNVSGVDDVLAILFQQNKTPFVDSTGHPLFNQGDAANDSSLVTRVLNFYTDFANPLRDTYAWNEDQPASLDAFTAGTTGFFFGYSYHTAAIKARAPQLNFGIMPLLQLDPDNRVNVANYWVQAVTLKSRHQNEAWGLVDYLTHSAATKEYLDATGRPTALRRYIVDQEKNLDLAPFVPDLLTSGSWYKGNNYTAAVQALQGLVHDWLQPMPDNVRSVEWRQTILDRAAAKIQQTF